MLAIKFFISETLHHLPKLEVLNKMTGDFKAQLIVLAVGIAVYVLGTVSSMKTSIKRFEKIDL